MSSWLYDETALQLLLLKHVIMYRLLSWLSRASRIAKSWTLHFYTFLLTCCAMLQSIRLRHYAVYVCACST